MFKSTPNVRSPTLAGLSGLGPADATSYLADSFYADAPLFLHTTVTIATTPATSATPAEILPNRHTAWA